MKKTTLLFFLLAAFLYGGEIDLSLYEKSIYSQNGEDGVLSKIFQTLPASSKFCVELGAGDGISRSNAHLLLLQEWKGVLLDREHAASQYNLYQEFVTAENLAALLQKYQVPHEFDLLSIDLAYNGFFIWQSLPSLYTPAVVVVKYNASHLPNEDKVVKYRPFYTGDETDYYGASILALYRLGQAKGYSLVYAEQSGVNLFFVRDDLLQNGEISFKNRNEVEKLYRNKASGRSLPDLKNRPYLSSNEVLK
ncbi:MAG TPA: hypothetical protein VLF94_05925 [Chlamydiales bacterium]|nr:hypothetical protein [Chlamydiales bacterium]